MKTIRNIKLLKDHISKIRKKGGTIGFVPTMGSLHDGHISLLKKSITENEHTICSIYVNPKQFNNINDLLNYPRNEEQDIEKIKSINCDIAFLPSDSEINSYNDLVSNYYFTNCFDKLEGKKRPGHFLGVVSIVHKLFDIIQPDQAYFGEKDYQQLWIIKLFKKKYNLLVQIKSCPTIRDNTGLALSSRNRRLTSKEKIIASNLFFAMQTFKKNIELHFRNNANKVFKKDDLHRCKNAIILSILKDPLIKLDYFEIIDSENFSFVNNVTYNKSYRVLIAAYVGKIRLIDNISINLSC